ncbi:uncharacterized protein LOC114061399 isoform X1 [Empidonax traillii]|uniref:uncharacterized protein LOC114061399 isoform X1 n=1 Tax=Empidonax traillii TaxID=164674 RepID=UPI000FFDA229|nr:uncharacterized protein LOC114061399 isoform X1 [Empidonax traillii]
MRFFRWKEVSFSRGAVGLEKQRGWQAHTPFRNPLSVRVTLRTGPRASPALAPAFKPVFITQQKKRLCQTGANMRSPSEESVPLHEEFIYCCGAATHVLKCGPWKDLSKDESKNLPRLLFMIIPVFSRCPLPANEAFSAWILPAWLCSNIRGGSDPSPAACSGLSWPELWESCVLGYFASFDNLKKDLFLFMGCLRQEGRRNYLLKDLPVKKIQCFCVHCVQIMQLKCLKRQQQCILPA